MRDLTGEEFSAYGVSKQEAGVALTVVPEGSKAVKAGLKQGDLIQRVNDQSVSKLQQFTEALKRLKTEELKLKVVRNQQAMELVTPLDKKLTFEATKPAGSKKRGAKKPAGSK